MWYAVESLQELVGVGVKVMGILLSLVFVVLEMEFKVSCTFGKYYNPEPQRQYGSYFRWEIIVHLQAACKQPDNV